MMIRVFCGPVKTILVTISGPSVTATAYWAALLLVFGLHLLMRQSYPSFLPALPVCVCALSPPPPQFLLEPLEALKEADERLGLTQGALAEVSDTVTG